MDRNMAFFPFPPTILSFMAGPKKYETLNSKFIVLQRGPEADIVTINTVLPQNSYDICLNVHLG